MASSPVPPSAGRAVPRPPPYRPRRCSCRACRRGGGRRPPPRRVWPWRGVVRARAALPICGGSRRHRREAGRRARCPLAAAAPAGAGRRRRERGEGPGAASRRRRHSSWRACRPARKRYPLVLFDNPQGWGRGRADPVARGPLGVPDRHAGPARYAIGKPAPWKRKPSRRALARPWTKRAALIWSAPLGEGKLSRPSRNRHAGVVQW